MISAVAACLQVSGHFLSDAHCLDIYTVSRILSASMACTLYLSVCVCFSISVWEGKGSIPSSIFPLVT